ncbi:MAG: ABC transporter ATP-binding protein [Spirochaetes bacterium]|nr:ABC transporter ATP-binding protein [Spirochaetota bacterium]
MITIKNLSFSYPKHKVFDSLEMNLESGKIYGLLGKNGSGKTTLFKLISGVLLPESGNIEIDGFNTISRSFKIYNEIFFYPEEIFIPEMKINEFINVFSAFYERFNKDKLYNLLKFMEIPEDYQISKLSYGMLKKFYLIFALSTENKIYLLDEPTIGLDIPSKSQFRKIILDSLQEDRIFIISSHQVKDFNRLLDEVIIIDNGKIIFKKEMEYINENYGVLFLPKDYPNRDYILYEEEVISGKICIVDKRKMIGLPENVNIQDIDLEILFNFVLTCKDKLSF